MTLQFDCFKCIANKFECYSELLYVCLEYGLGKYLGFTVEEDMCPTYMVEQNFCIKAGAQDVSFKDRS